MSSIPVYFLTGYLGAGKTTALNHLLRQPELRDRRCCLIINEFGSLGVDGQLLPNPDSQLYEINRGSLFCACTKTEFLDTLNRITRDASPDLVIAEATGVGETSDLLDIFSRPQVRDQFHIRANICMVDAKNFTKVLPFLKAAHAQVRLADGVVLNKSDLLRESAMVRLSTLISELNPEAPQVCVQRGRVPWQFVQQLSHGSPPAASPATPPAEISVCTLEGDWADRPRLRSAVDKLGARLLRLKGIVDFGQGSVLVESVFGSYEETSVSHPATSPGVTAIGWNIEAQQLRATLAPCIRSTSKLVTFR